MSIFLLGAPPPSVLSGIANLGMALESGMFKNKVMEMSGMQDSTDTLFFTQLTASGYPNNSWTNSGIVFSTLPMASNLTGAEYWVLKWTGYGQVKLGLSAGVTNLTVTTGTAIGNTNFNLTLDGTNARAVFQFVGLPPSISIGYMPVTFSSFGNLVLCKLTDEAALASATKPDDYWADDYVAAYQYLNPKVVRTMGWSNPNFGCVSQSKYIPAWTAMPLVSNQSYPPGAWAGATFGGTGGLYTVGLQPDATPGVYVDKETIQVQWNVGQAGVAVYLNSGGRGSLPVNVGTGSSTGSPQAYLSTGEVGTLTYDKLTNAFWYQQGPQTPIMPYELQAGFANRVNAHLWTNFPVYIDDTSVPVIVGAVQTYLNSGLDAYFEYGNEPWNAGFPMYHYLTSRGNALGFPSGSAENSLGAQALRIGQIMPLVKSAWTASSSRLKRVMNCMSVAYGNIPGTKTFLLEGNDCNGSTYPNYATAGYTNYDTYPNRPIDYCEVLTYGTYYNGAQTLDLDQHYEAIGATAISTGGPSGWTTGLLGAADAYAAGGSTNIANAFAFLDWDIRQGTASGVAGGQTLLYFNNADLGYGAIGVYASWEGVAASYDSGRTNPLTVENYEGAMQSWYPSSAACTSMGISTAYGDSTGKIAVLLDAFKKTGTGSGTFYKMVRDQWTSMMAQSHSKTPVWFLVPGPSEWSMSTSDLYGMMYQSYNAFHDLNNGL